MTNRSRLHLALLAALVAPVPAAGEHPSAAHAAAARTRAGAVTAFQHSDVDLAWQAAQRNQRPMLLFVSSSNCRFCTKMIRETYSHPEIARALAATCETTILKREQRPELVKQLRVRAFPTTIVVAPDGRELGRIEGFLSAQKFAARMFPPVVPDEGRASAPTGAAVGEVAQR